MRKPVKILLTAGVAAALVACGRRAIEPCDQATFNEQGCQNAVSHGGYYWGGSWYPMHYSHPYPYYYDHYTYFRSHNGAGANAPANGGPHSSSPGSVVRGGFGSAGAAHGGGGGQ